MSAAPAVMIGSVLSDGALVAAVADAARLCLPVLEQLEKTSGLGAEELAAALASAFDYRCLAREELQATDPAFDLLSATDAQRHRCVLVREDGRLLAVMADPFDAQLRPWLEARVTAPLSWALALPLGWAHTGVF